MSIQKLIEMAIEEDLPDGDITTEALSLESKNGRARLIAKQDMILSGTSPFEQTLKHFNTDIDCSWRFKDGEPVLSGQNIAVIKGSLAAMLRGERIALNFLGHLSGIATLTNKYVRQIQGTKILDTRKTLPGWRALEKRAVVDGGGVNHRLSLSEKIMIKDNHIKAVGGITQALQKISSPKDIIIEVKSVSDVEEALNFNVGHLLLDNMDNETLEKCLSIIPDSIKTEVSGKISLDRVQSIAKLGVDYISVGAITHSAPIADISMSFE